MSNGAQALPADERMAFEAWMTSDACACFPERMHNTYPPGYVEAAERDAAWEGWQARAALAAAPPASAPVPVLTDERIAALWPNVRFDICEGREDIIEFGRAILATAKAQEDESPEYSDAWLLARAKKAQELIDSLPRELRASLFLTAGGKQ